jgi:light-regulated signal transduction histidine kinase (bacteriophytochrome)
MNAARATHEPQVALPKVLHRSSARGRPRARNGPRVAPPRACTVPGAVVRAGQATFECLVHRSEGLVVTELEPLAEQLADESGLLHVMARLEGIERLDDLWSTLAGVVRQLTGFDRVMIYRFDEDDCGEVVAEARGDEVEGFLGLRYPASDIPAQARRLYALNRVRLIPDATYSACPIVPPDHPRTGRALDLSGSLLRSVSPIHLEYLANMRVRASMSTSILRGERLWGLIACHHLTPRHASRRVRSLCELLADFVSSSLSPRLEREELRRRVHAGSVQALLGRALAGEADLEAALLRRSPNAPDVIDAGGFVLAHEGRLASLGPVPSDAQLSALVEWLRREVQDEVLVTDALASRYPPAAEFSDVGSGLLAASMRARGLHLLWLRPEVVREVRWAGDPRRPAELEAGRLTPRRSFQLWREAVRLRARPWTPWEVETAGQLRALIADLALRQEAEHLELRLELRRATRMREEFLSMASHELRTPLATLRLNLDALRRAAQRTPLDPAVLGRRLEAADRQRERLEVLLRRLIDASQLEAGRLHLARTPMDLGALAREVAGRFAKEAPELRLRVTGDPVGDWDAARLDQVLSNLLSNAVKYGLGRPIEVAVSGDPMVVRVAVTDRGIGIPPEGRERLFRRFERAVTPSAYQGLGLGLWIARTLVEMHGGDIMVESTPGMGATFTVTLPRGSSRDRAARPA